MHSPDLAGARWTRSSYSTSGQCVELASGPSWVAMRDSKNPDGSPLVLSRAAMAHFLAGVKAAEFDQ